MVVGSKPATTKVRICCENRTLGEMYHGNGPFFADHFGAKLSWSGGGTLMRKLTTCARKSVKKGPGFYSVAAVGWLVGWSLGWLVGVVRPFIQKIIICHYILAF